MPTCVLHTCKNYYSKKDNNVRFHKFRRRGHETREAWIKFVQRDRREETWLPTTYSFICSAHFKDSDKYVSKSGHTHLKKTAIPCHDNTRQSVDSKINIEDPISETVSDSESIFDTPEKIVLKSKLSKETAARKKLAIRFRKLQSQNRYLKKKCECYKSMVMDLKTKFGLNTQGLNDYWAKSWATMSKSLDNEKKSKNHITKEII